MVEDRSIHDRFFRAAGKFRRVCVGRCGLGFHRLHADDDADDDRVHHVRSATHVGRRAVADQVSEGTDTDERRTAEAARTKAEVRRGWWPGWIWAIPIAVILLI